MVHVPFEMTFWLEKTEGGFAVPDPGAGGEIVSDNGPFSLGTNSNSFGAALM